MSRILLTGATGYVGGRLLPALLARDHEVRCFTRRPEFLRPRVPESVEISEGDAFDETALTTAMSGMETAFFMVHSLGGSEDFEERDRQAATTFASAAQKAGVQKIIYLGGLGKGEHLSKHLASRQEVGEILRASTVPTIELRASIIIGSGSLSFEMVRSLVEKLPVMTTPRWVRSAAQPIAIGDVIRYLVGAAEREITRSELYEIGGADSVSYHGIMEAYARARNLRRLILPVPFLTPKLSGLWLALVTPLYYRVGRWLIDGVKNETTADDAQARKVFGVSPLGIDEAIRQAITAEDQEFAATRWSDALLPGSGEESFGGEKRGSRRVYSIATRIPATRQEVFLPIQYIGGHRGWYSYQWLWSLRSALDKIAGGVGGSRGRRDPLILLPGDVVDFWRVEELDQYRMLRLRAEMKLPGRGWLQFDIEDGETDAECVARITAIFEPRGLFGLIYWFSLFPAHKLIFGKMLAEISHAAHHGPPD